MWTSFIGFMGCGKSSVTNQLSTATSRPAVSLDALVAERAGISIPQIFKTQGERRFREMELETLADLDAQQNLIVDTGGGIVETPAALEILRQQGVIIWLDPPWGVIRERLQSRDTGQRPLIEKLGWAGIVELYRKRRRIYAGAADFRLSGRIGTASDIARTAMLRSLIWERRQEGKR